MSSCYHPQEPDLSKSSDSGHSTPSRGSTRDVLRAVGFQRAPPHPRRSGVLHEAGSCVNVEGDRQCGRSRAQAVSDSHGRVGSCFYPVCLDFIRRFNFQRGIVSLSCAIPHLGLWVGCTAKPLSISSFSYTFRLEAKA